MTGVNSDRKNDIFEISEDRQQSIKILETTNFLLKASITRGLGGGTTYLAVCDKRGNDSLGNPCKSIANTHTQMRIGDKLELYMSTDDLFSWASCDLF